MKHWNLVYWIIVLEYWETGRTLDYVWNIWWQEETEKMEMVRNLNQGQTWTRKTRNSTDE